MQWFWFANVNHFSLLISNVCSNAGDSGCISVAVLSMLESVQGVRETYFPPRETEKNDQWLLLKAVLCNPPLF